MNRNSFFKTLATLVAFVVPFAVQAQTSISEDFTKATTTNSWYFFNGACLTASGTSGSEPVSAGVNGSFGASGGSIPGCSSIASTYYNKSSGEVLVGGYNGTFPDPPSTATSAPGVGGALRFTNGYPYGYHENGGIVSTTPFPTDQGVAITFKTVTYLGDKGGAGKDGADGISFFLMDASQLNTSTGAITLQSQGNGNGLGAWGGSLGYSCSNSNSPYNGLMGGYLGVGIDEYGNFLNGTTNTLGETGTTASGDNTASGGGYQPGRIGLRGAGNISWTSLNAAYGSNPNNTAQPYYPSSLLTSCGVTGGTYNSTTGGCMTCSNGTYVLGTNTCVTTSCATGSTYNATTGQCESCPSGDTYNSSPNNCSTKTCATGSTYNSTTGQCETCPTGDAYTSSSNSCLTQTCATGTYNASANKCEACSTGTYNSSANKCEVCSTGTYNSAANLCEVCATGYTYNSGTGMCTKGALTASPTTHAPTASTPTASSPTSITATGSATLTVSSTASSTLSPTPTTGLVDWYYAVQNTCKTGTLWNYATPSAPTSAGATSLTNTANTAGILDYTAIPLGYALLQAGTQIANETATTRAQATPIYYQLKITQNGLLSLSYSVCPTSGCASWISVLTSQNITTANGQMPNNFLFGFAGSTGGSSNIHEILCFRADPATSASSSAGAAEKQSAKLETGVQAYFAYYNPSNGWTGRVTASFLTVDAYGNIGIAATPNWDASCVLDGNIVVPTCPTTNLPTAAAELPNNPTAANSRQIITWNNGGVAFQWGNLSTAQQTALNLGNPTTFGAQDRLNFLRGDRSNEIQAISTGEFRRRTSVLADIIDSSPAWVGAPSAPYAVTWIDRIHTAQPTPETASGATTYATYAANAATRTQVVYVGANDGLLHGFRSGYYNASTTACQTTPSASCFTNNDGLELLAYIPGSTIAGTSSIPGTPPTPVTGPQLIHPDISATAPVTNVNIDYSNPQYGHNYFVDATPGTGDVFYNGNWHSVVVGGLGAGGPVIYALDVTDPTQFSENNANKLALGEWNSVTISCQGNASCGTNLGNTYGTPQMRRLHDGRWAVIFGNGLGSATGDAGIFIMTLDPTSGFQNTVTYYLSTNTASTTTPNGIAYVTPADLDGDHITDYVYAGDVLGNVWRFDLTSTSEASWGVTPGPLFNTGGQPITTQLVVASGSPTPGAAAQVMVLFGTGQKIGVTNTTGVQYASGGSLYGVWDWNLTASDGGLGGPGAGGGWDGLSSATYNALPRATVGFTTLTAANLATQTVTSGVGGNRDITTNAVPCWNGGCPGSPGRQFGWTFALPGTQEQVIYSPELVAQAFTVNSIIPAQNAPTNCTLNTDTGYTYVVQALTGGAFNTVFLPPGEQQFLNANPSINAAPYQDASAIGMQTNATGSSFITTNSAGTQYLVYETNQVQGGAGGTGGSNNLQGGTLGLNLPPNTTGRRLSWIELR
jgi:type IV pilus assembly protein PilY1